jgi:peptidylprolyl isomerase
VSDGVKSGEPGQTTSASAPAKAASAKAGSTKAGSTRSQASGSAAAGSGSAKSAPVKSAPVKSAAAGSGAARSAPVKSAAAGSGAAKSGTVESAAAGSGAAKSGTVRSAPARSVRPVSTKAERRAAAKAARAAAARRRRLIRIGSWAGAAVLVVAVIVGVFLVVGGDEQPTATASASGAPAAQACGAAFPPIPEGADPALCTKPTVTAGTGQLTELKVTTLIEGTGAAVAAGQSLTVNYVGVTYTSGEEFDASWKDQRPYPFVLGEGRVIPGWDQGLVGVKVGSRVQLDIPSNLAYGDSGDPAGPLRFVVDVLAAS